MKAALMADIGDALRSLGDYAAAEPLLRGALELRKVHRNDAGVRTDLADLASSLHAVGWLEHDRGNYADAEKLFREALAIRNRQTPKDALGLAEIEFNLAWTLADQDRADEAIKLFKGVVNVRRQMLGKKHRETQMAEIGLIGAMSVGQEGGASAASGR